MGSDHTPMIPWTGDRLVLMVRVKPHLLFGLIVHMALMFEKDVEAFYLDVTSSSRMSKD